MFSTILCVTPLPARVWGVFEKCTEFEPRMTFDGFSKIDVSLESGYKQMNKCTRSRTGGFIFQKNEAKPITACIQQPCIRHRAVSFNAVNKASRRSLVVAAHNTDARRAPRFTVCRSGKPRGNDNASSLHGGRQRIPRKARSSPFHSESLLLTFATRSASSTRYRQ